MNPARTRMILAGGVAISAYAYAGYPLVMPLLARRRRPREASAGELPSMTVVVPAYNEEAVIVDKIRDLHAQRYPARLDIIVVADGSTDDTARLAREAGATVLHDRARGGKSAAVNRGVAAASGKVVCLTDANCLLDPGTLAAVGRSFLDPDVGVVSGAKTVVGTDATAVGEGIYWRIEDRVKRAESAFGCTMGAPGEICAIRRRAFRPIPPGTINDDYHITCDVLRRGWKATYEPTAIAREAPSQTLAEEVERRTRVAAGTCQTTLQHLALADPRRGWTAFAFVSHRLLRSVVAPPALVAVFAASLVSARRDVLARRALGVEALAVMAAAGGLRSSHPAFAAPFEFALVNLTTLRGAGRLLTGRQPVAWRKATRVATPSPPP